VLIEILQLARYVVDVPFKCHDLLDEILLLLFSLSDLVGSAADVFLSSLKLDVEFFVFSRDLLNGRIQAFDLKTCVSVILQNIFFFQLKSPGMLLGASFTVSKLVILIFEKFVCVAAFTELLVDKPILSG
jgi:hypothetical protein